MQLTKIRPSLTSRQSSRKISDMSRYVSREVLDQVYKLYVRPHLDYGHIFYHKFDPDMKLDVTKNLNRPSTLRL